MSGVGYWLVLILVFAVGVPIALRFLAVPVIRAFEAHERRRAEDRDVARGAAVARQAERGATGPPDQAT